MQESESAAEESSTSDGEGVDKKGKNCYDLTKRVSLCAKNSTELKRPRFFLPFDHVTLMFSFPLTSDRQAGLPSASRRQEIEREAYREADSGVIPPHAVGEGDDTIVPEVDDRRPVAGTHEDEEAASSAKRKVAYSELIARMDEVMDEQERRREKTDDDKGMLVVHPVSARLSHWEWFAVAGLTM